MGAELADQDIGDGFGKCFEQLQLVLDHQVAQALADDAVVDRVGDAVGVAGARAPQAHVHVDDQRLWTVQFRLVDADHRLAHEALDEDQVKCGVLPRRDGRGGHGPWIRELAIDVQHARAG